MRIMRILGFHYFKSWHARSPSVNRILYICLLAENTLNTLNTLDTLYVDKQHATRLNGEILSLAAPGFVPPDFVPPDSEG